MSNPYAPPPPPVTGPTTVTNYNEPWYKKPWLWVGVALAAVVVMLAILITAVVAGGDDGDDKPKAVATQSAEPSEDSSVDATDDNYLAAARDLVPVLSSIPDDELIDIGNEVCSIFSSGPINSRTVVGSINAFSGGTDGLMDQSDTAKFFGVATSSYCPDIYDDIMAALDSPSA